MAALVVTPAQLELINSLGQDEIPIKLRCAIDSRLAVNAFRLPCCDQSICESCHATLPSTCPVCEHSPVAAEDCKPNKSLRTTIKVFLRTEEKKREVSKAKEVHDSAPVTPVVEVPPISAEETKKEQVVGPTVDEAELAEPATTDVAVVDAEANDGITEEAIPEDQKDVPHPTIEEIAPDQQPVEQGGLAVPTAEGNENGVVQLHSQNDVAEEGSNDLAGGENASLDFNGMNMSGDFNQMQMMMAMQNGMGAAGFGNFPMMGMPGMPGMSMDPMMMQNMFMNGGFGVGGMSMGGMNMGMGMGGFNAGSEAGFNGWNGQQNSWNVGPDNFNNHPNASGMMGHGDYRANNSGFTPNSSGFNHQGNYGNSQYNDFNSYGNNYGYRGRGRGRGGFGRGGFAHNHQDHFQNYSQQQNGLSETGSSVAEKKPEAGNVDEFGRELRPASQTVEGDKPEGDEPVAESDAKDDNDAANTTNELKSNEAQQHQNENTQMPIKSLEDDNAAYMQMNGGYSNSYGAYSQPYGGRNGAFHVQAHAVKPAVPINAPTGPKAMREGLPNVGYRPRQSQQPVVVNAKTNGSVSGSVRAESEMPGGHQNSRSPSRDRSRDRSKERTRERSRERSRDRSRERSRDRSRDRKRSRSRERHHRRHRHRSESLSEDEKETQRRRERRRERRARREQEEARVDAEDESDDEGKDDVNKSRSASPSDHKRSSHRSSRREKDKHRDSDRERDRDRDYKSSSHKHRSHRSRRDDRSRSRDRDRDRDRERDRDKDRDRERGRDRDYEHRRHHSRRGSPEVSEKEKFDSESVPATPVEDVTTSRKQSIVSNSAAGLEIRGASSRRKPLSAEMPNIPTGPRSDRERARDLGKGRFGSGKTYNDSSARSHRDSESRPSKDNRDRNDNRRSSYSASGDREKEKPSSRSDAKTASVDPHTLEREARNRERLLKEAQRMAGLTGSMGRKRSRDDGAEEKGGRSDSRKKGRRGGVVGEEDEEARMNRLEAEREAARWT